MDRRYGRVVNIGSNLQPINPHPNDITTTEGSVRHKSSFTYDSEWNTTERDETDWYAVGGSGTVISKITAACPAYFLRARLIPIRRLPQTAFWRPTPPDPQPHPLLIPTIRRHSTTLHTPARARKIEATESGSATGKFACQRRQARPAGIAYLNLPVKPLLTFPSG